VSSSSQDPNSSSSAAPTRPRLFLSYGRRDAAALANRLRTDLEARGFEVWQDTRHIRTGREWEEEIKDGLRSTQVVVALLSPHAVRRSLDPSSPDNLDSVCLDEISFARFAHPPKPIVPVMAMSCEPPFCIFRLDYTDMTRWSESEDQYRIGCERLLLGLEAALRGEPPAYRRWHHFLPSLDFSAYLHEKRQDFVGREWLFDLVDAWRTASGRERTLLITGDPGAGKSAFVAEMVHRNPGSQVLAYHCCMAEDHQSLEPGAFVQSVAAMIASQLPSYADQLEDPSLQRILTDATSNPGGALDRGILAPLERLPVPVEGVRLILIDALDEALLVGDAENNIVTLLAPRLERLPGWLRLVATTRKEREILDRLGGLRAATIDAQAADNLADLDMFIEARLAAPELAERLAASRVPVAEVQRRLHEAATGNFLYVKMALQDIERDHYSFAHLSELPGGLPGIYRRFFDRQFSERTGGYHNARAVLEVIVAGQVPLTLDLLKEASGLDGEYALPQVLGTLSALVPQHTDKYSFYHKSLSDWLTDVKCAYRASALRGHERFANAFLQYLDTFRATVPCTRSYEKDQHSPVPALHAYWTKYGLSHLAYSNLTLPIDMAPECLAPILYAFREPVTGLGSWTQEVPRFARDYIARLIQNGQTADLLNIIRLFKHSARFKYIKSGLLEESTGQITGSAEDGHAVVMALVISGWAGAIVRAAKREAEARPTSIPIKELSYELAWFAGMARGFEIAGWGDGIARSFQDMGGLLYRELIEVKYGSYDNA
jgi:hypothetical protein